MELVEEVKKLIVETAKTLKGSARRLFMARTATAEWYDASHLVNPEGVNTDLGHDLIDTLMQ
jgi:hypothetical protein